MADSDNETAAGAPATKKTAVDVVTDWFNSDIQNSEIARHTGVYNLLLAAVEKLKAALAQQGD